MDLERIAVDTLDKYNELKRSHVLYLDNGSHKLVFSGEDTTPLTEKEYEIALRHYRQYSKRSLEGGGCVGCTMQELANVESEFNQFLREIKIKYYDDKGV